MDEEATKLPREPKKEPEDAANPEEGVSGQESEGRFQIAPDFALPSAKDITIAGSASLPLAAPNIYILEWGLTRDSHSYATLCYV